LFYLFAKGFKAVGAALSTKGKVTLSLANGMFSNSGFEVLEPFKKALKEGFNTSLQTVNFGKDADTIINKWVEEKTKDKIKDLFNEKSFDGLTKIVLVSAIYFKGDWKFKVRIAFE
jgi:serine protease inhibitor